MTDPAAAPAAPETVPEPGPPRRRRIGRLLLAAAVALGLAGGAYAVFDSAGAPSAGSADAAPAPVERVLQLAPVEVTTVAPADLRREVRVGGTTRPVDQVVLKARVSETLVALPYREGQEVPAGAVVARFDDVGLKARLDEKLANLQGARAQADWARINEANQRTLRQRGAAAQTALDQADSQRRNAEATVAGLEAQVAVAQRNLADAVVTAPFAGVVAERPVNPGETPAIGATLLRLVDLSRLEIEAPVPATEIGAVQVGQKAVLTLEGFGERRFEARVERIAPTAAEGSRAITVYLVLDNPDRGLRGGLFAQGGIVVAEAPGALALPAAAVREDAEGTHVLAVVNGRLERRAVARGRSWDGGALVEVTGVAPGDKVVSAPLPNLQPGARVRLAAG